MVWPRNDDSKIQNIYILDSQPPLKRINEVGQYVIDIDQKWSGTNDNYDNRRIKRQ